MLKLPMTAACSDKKSTVSSKYGQNVAYFHGNRMYRLSIWRNRGRSTVDCDLWSAQRINVASNIGLNQPNLLRLGTPSTEFFKARCERKDVDQNGLRKVQHVAGIAFRDFDIRIMGGLVPDKAYFVSPIEKT